MPHQPWRPPVWSLPLQWAQRQPARTGIAPKTITRELTTVCHRSQNHVDRTQRVNAEHLYYNSPRYRRYDGTIARVESTISKEVENGTRNDEVTTSTALKGRRRSTPFKSTRQTYVAEQLLAPAKSSAGITNEEKDVSQTATQRLDSDKALEKFLQSGNYSREDLELWTQLVNGADVLQSVETLHLRSAFNEQRDQSLRPVPSLVFMLILKRETLASEALRSLIAYAWNEAHLLQMHRTSEQNNADMTDRIRAIVSIQPPMEELTAFIMVERLIKHARRSLPEALRTLALLFTFLLRVHDSKEGLRGVQQAIRRREQVCNRMLVLLSYPCPSAPFAYAAVQKKAQFDVLRGMMQCHPAVHVNRAGFQAVARTQLADKKDERERDWSSLKAKSWPPWKHDRTGLDARKGFAYGTPRALEAIQQARRAGYGSGLWEHTASILSGWDVDLSPTIQTRALLSRTRTRKHENTSTPVSSDHPKLWAARIRATRTVNEAWAAFLAFEDKSLPAHHDVYFAMIEKLHHRGRKEISPEVSDGAPAIEAGDARELFRPPPSLREGTYVRTPAPSMSELAQRMHRDGIVPSPRCLSYLITHAASLEEGLKYMEWGSTSVSALSTLLTLDEVPNTTGSNAPLRVFSAFVGLLCRHGFAWAHVPSIVESLQNDESVSRNSWFSSREKCIPFARQLLYARMPRYLPPWHALLHSCVRYSTAGLSRSDAVPTYESYVLQQWKSMQDIRRHMRTAGLALDAEAFRLMCAGAERTLRASKPLNYPTPSPNDSSHENTDIHRAIVPYMRKLFYSLAGTHDARQIAVSGRDVALERIDAGLKPSALHGYARLIGVAGNWHILLEFVRWMALHAVDIDAATDLTRNGPRMLRRTLVAVRVFCERRWVDTDDTTGVSGTDGAKDAAALREQIPSVTLEKIKSVIENVEGWGGWPTEAEADEYCFGAAAGKFPS